MQAHHPIGVFDSGIGGLTNVKALKELLPQEQFIYVGDTAHLPYGDKSPELLREYVQQIVAFLLAQPVKAVVIACNTASAVAFQQVQAQCAPVPVFEVVQPAVQAALHASRTAQVGMIGTKTTVQSHIYLRSLLELQPDARIVEKATPLLVPMIEEGWADNSITTQVIEAYLSDTGFTHIDTLILGCTHYPLIQQMVQEYFAHNHRQPVTVINSAQPTAEAVKAHLAEAGLLREAPAQGQDQFYVSDLTAGFVDAARLFFGHSVALQKLHVAPVQLGQTAEAS